MKNHPPNSNADAGTLEEWELRIIGAVTGQSQVLTHRERDETEQVRALRIVQEELKRRGWTKAELKRWRKGDARKVALARRLREQTTVSLRWIAENLHMGTWTHVSNRFSH